jgi:molybdenum cofactor synthesis domain-containing protein
MIRAAVVTVSDRVSRGEAPDVSGARLKQGLEESGKAIVLTQRQVPDEMETIGAVLLELSAKHQLVVTTGGTGLAPRDVTPEATEAVIERRLPGIEEAIRAEGRTKTPLAALSRGVAGARGGCLIVNLPGSPAAVGDGLRVLLPLLEHVSGLLAGQVRDCMDARDSAGDGPSGGAGGGAG